MADTENIMERLGELEQTVEKLRVHNLTLEMAFLMLWHFSFVMQARLPWHESSSALLEIVASVQRSGEAALRSDEIPEDERARRLEMFAEAIEELRERFSLKPADDPQE